MKKNLLVFLVVLLAFATFSFAQTSVLTFEDYVRQIKEQIPEMKINASKVATAENALISAKSINNVILNANTGAMGKHGDAYTINPLLGGTSNGFKLGVGAQSTISASGTQLNLDISQDMNIRTATPHEAYYAPSVSFSISQPLLHNIFGVLDRYPIKDAQTGIEIAKIVRKINDASALKEYQNEYIRWIMLEKLVVGLTKTVDEAVTFESQIQRRMQSGLTDNDTYQNAIHQTLQYKNSLSEQEEKLKLIKVTINFFIPIANKTPDFAMWDITQARAESSTLPLIPFNKTVYSSYTEQLKVRVNQALAAAKNGILPQLNLFASTQIGGSPLAGNYFDSFGKSNNIQYFAGLQFVYPLGNNAARAKQKEAENNLYAIIAECEKMEQDFVLQLNVIISNFEMYKEMLANNKLQIAAMESRLATQSQKLAQGRQDLDEIIRTRLNLTELKINQLNLQYQIAVAGFEFVSLLALNDIADIRSMQ